MKFFIDSANADLIKKFIDMNIVDGVTTNPSLLAKEGKDPIEQVKKILKLVPGPVSIEVVATEYGAMLSEARPISKLGKNAVVKIPMTRDGMRAVHTLSQEGIKTNVTLVFSATQALIAAKAGATYVSPFVGRLDDIGTDGMPLISDIVQIFRNYSIKTQVLVASVRHPIHVVEAAKLGADVATLPPDVLDKMFSHPLTDAGLKKFLDDWKTLQKQYGDDFSKAK
jgi:transaldolase